MNTKLLGGGGINQVYLSSSKKSFKNSFFKPIVANSLALLFGSALYADGSITTNCGTNGSCNPITGDVVIQWGTIDNNANFSINNTSNTTTITFNKDGSGNGTTTGRVDTVNFKDAEFKNNQIFTSENNHKMTIDFGSNTGKTFNLEAKNDFSLAKGTPNNSSRLIVSGTSADSKFTATFAKNVTGRFNIGDSKTAFNGDATFTFGSAAEELSNSQETTQKLDGYIRVNSAKSSFTFKNNIEVTEGIWVLGGKNNTFSFEKSADLKAGNEVIYIESTATSSGSNSTATYTFANDASIKSSASEKPTAIKAQANSDGGNANANATNTITFQGSTNTITGQIVAATNNNSLATLVAKNDITFNAENSNNTINGIIQTDTGPKSVNDIKFNNTSGTNTITGEISSGPGTNTITFGSVGDRQAKTEVTNTITGSITANGGTNTITFNGDATNSIGSNGTTSNVITASSGTNKIVFNGSGTNSVTNGISATGGKNNLTFSAGTNTITGNITANGGTNNISMNSTNTITGTITAGTGGNTGTNNLYFSGTSTTIGSTESLDSKATAVSIIANNASNNNTNKYNFLKLESQTNKITLDALQALGGNKAKNIISLDGVTAGAKTTSTSNVTIKTMTANSGYNYIGKNIITGSNTTDASALSFTDSASSMSFVKDTNAFTGTLSIGSMSSSSGGVNNISYQASTTLSKEFKTNTQNAIIGTLSSDGNLTTVISGNNNLYLDLSKNTDFANVSSISGTLESFDLSKLQSVILGNVDNGASQDIQGGTNNIKIVGKTATQEVLGSDTDYTKVGLVGNITTTGGTNNLIFVDSIWLPHQIILTSDDSNKTITLPSGTLTNTNGTTNVVLRETGKNVLGSKGTSIFNVNTTGASGKTNIVVNGEVNIGADINYDSSATTTFIFANGNDMANTALRDNATDDFGNSSSDLANNKVLGVTYQDGMKFEIKDKTIKVDDSNAASFLEKYGSYFVSDSSKPTLTLTTNRTSNGSNFHDTIEVTGLAIGTVSALARSTTNKDKTAQFDVTLNKDSVFFGGFDFSKIQSDSGALSKTILTLKMNQGSKFFTDTSVALQNLEIVSGSFDLSQTLLNTFNQSNIVIDLGSYGNDNNNILKREEFNLLSIGTSDESTGLKGENALFRVYANADANQGSATLGGVQSAGAAASALSGAKGQYGYVYADRVIVTSTQESNKQLKEYIQVLYDSDILGITGVKYAGNNTGTETAGNIAVFTVKQADNEISGATGNDAEKKALVKLETTDVLQGFDVVGTTLTGVTTDMYGKVTKRGDGGYTTYFISDVGTKGISTSNKDATASALGANYNLYLANMNSLNKRMGELRENANSQGAWVRIFNGMQTSKFALETKSIYTTIQAGYDYAFGFNGANNYLGFAISYINSVSDSKESLDIDNATKALKNSASNGVEFAIYNAYVQDGASKDTNFKNGLYTDSILKFSFLNNKLEMSNQSDTYNINNYAITFSQEVGYRFLLGKAKEFYIDPQAEISLGYLNQSDLKQKLATAYLSGIQDSIFTLRGRIGSNFGYDFKNFTQDKGFNAKIYLGTYFVGDYISGGDITLTSNLGTTNTISPLASTTRFVLNLGTNFKIKDAHRIYFDFERSFGGKIITDYQINLGYRYSFGASNYTPYNLSNTQEIKDTNSIKEIEPTKGYYLELLNKQDLSKKESKLLKDLKDLKVKTNNNTKTYLIGPFENEDAALKQKQALQGLLKELSSEGNVIVIE